MRKVLFVVIAVLLIAIGVYSLSGSSSDYSSFVPEDAFMTFAISSPVEFAQKFPKDEFPQLFDGAAQQAKAMMRGKDLFSKEFYVESGLDPRKSIGISILNIGPTPNHFSALMFFGVHDAQKFIAYTKTMAPNTQYTEKTLGTMNCFVINTGNPYQGGVITFLEGYCVLYLTSLTPDDNLEQKFSAEFGEYENRLADSASYKRGIKELGSKGDFFMHMDYQKLFKVYETMPEVKDVMAMVQENVKDVLTYSGYVSCTNKGLEMAAYVDYEEGSELLDMVKGEGSCKALASALPKNPLVFTAMAANFSKVWPMYKQMLDYMFKMPNMPNMPEGMNMEKLLGEANNNIKEQLGVEVNVENDFITNVKGNMAMAFYNLPKDMETIDFDLVLGAELADANAFSGALAKIINAVNSQGEAPMFQEIKIGDTVGWTVDVNAFGPPQPTAITPCVAFFNNHIVFSSKKDILEKIVSGAHNEDNLLASIGDTALRQEVEKGGMMQVYINTAELFTQGLNLVPDPEMQKLVPLAKRFQEIRSISQVRPQGGYSNMIWQTEEDFITTVIRTVLDAQQLQLQNPFGK